MFRSLALLATGAVLLVGCLLQPGSLAQSPEPAAEPTFEVVYTLVPASTSTPTPLPPPPAALPGAVGPYTFPPDVNPLTGLSVGDPAVLNRRPIVVKISNAPPLVRPQAGLAAADLVFEHYVEGGLTRFSAVYYSHLPEKIGSIRSARLMDYELVPAYQALFAYSGGSTGVNNVIAASDFGDRHFMGIAMGAPYYWRDETIPAPHNLFVNIAALTRLASEQGINTRQALDGMAFLSEPPPNPAGDATSIEVEYVATRVRWEYDPAIGAYRRFSDGQPHLDAATGEQVTAENVVVLYADHTLSDIVESEWQGNVSYGWHIKLWFEGDAVLFRDGKRYAGRWLRPTREDMIQLRTQDGELLYFKPGNTWFQVVKLPGQMDPAEEGVTVQ